MLGYELGVMAVHIILELNICSQLHASCGGINERLCVYIVFHFRGGCTFGVAVLSGWLCFGKYVMRDIVRTTYRELVSCVGFVLKHVYTSDILILGYHSMSFGVIRGPTTFQNLQNCFGIALS